MPIYDYHCDHCGHTFAAVGGFNDPPLAVCARCGKEPRRLIRATAIVFKGSGWYKTDSRSASPSDDNVPKPTAAATATADPTAPPTAESSAPAGGNDKASESKPAGSKPEGSKPGSTPAATGGTERTGRPGESMAAPTKSKPAVKADSSKSEPASPR